VQFLYAATILSSAALMFIVEPMFAKMVLPRLGGSPGVWNTCLVFYQAVLLAGYVYAHLSLKWLGPRRQAVLHLALMSLPWICFCLPIRIAPGWTPPDGGNPAAWLLLLLTASVGLPFLSLSASAPVLQAWFAHSGGRSAKDPYFLYAASNLGSLGGLAAYPLWIEPRLTLQSQTGYWSAAYLLLMALFVLCAAVLWRATNPNREQPSTSPKREQSNTSPKRERGDKDWRKLPSLALRVGMEDAPADAPIALRRRLHWLALSIVPAALLMGVTAHLTIDLASQPLLWAIPLGLYLLSFILAFARWPIADWLWLVRIVQAVGLVAAAATVYLEVLPTHLTVGVCGLHLAAFFLTALVCHGTLAADRPASGHLTEYYLWMSTGGVVGGLICALVAPLIFNSVVEYPLMIAAACLLGPRWRFSLGWLPRWFDGAAMLLEGCLLAFSAIVFWNNRLAEAADQWREGWLKNWAEAIAGDNGKIGCVVAAAVAAVLLQRRRTRFFAAVVTLLVTCMTCCADQQVLYRTRSFFGALRIEISHYKSNGETFVSHRLMHGSTLHGEQSCDPNDRQEAREPWTYFERSGPVGDVFDALEDRPQFLRHGRIGIVGLGTGTIAAYAKAGQKLTYYEIDAAVRRIAEDRRFFTYLADCQVTPEIRMGDARLTLAEAPAGRFDLLTIDAFSSDAIPVHLLTREAFEMYFEKLSPQGLLLVHLTNRHLNLAPVVARAAAELGVVARVRDDNDLEPLAKCSSTWAVLCRTPQDLGWLDGDDEWQPLEPQPGDPLWTDDFSSIVSVMDWDWLPQWMRKAILGKEDDGGQPTTAR
jgi:hypothetical protein